MVECLQDSSSGLLKHIYDAEKKVFVRDKLWATGNGWALLGMISVCDIAKEKDCSKLNSLFCF